MRSPGVGCGRNTTGSHHRLLTSRVTQVHVSIEFDPLLKVPSSHSHRCFMTRYLEPRVDISLDVKVWGMDLYGKPFVQHARTVNASSVVARLIGIDCVREGEVISMQHGEQQARCKVVWVGRDAARSRQIGIFCLEAGKSLFGRQLLARTPPASGFVAGFAGRS